MKKIARLLGLSVLAITSLSGLTSCGKTGFKVGLLCLHGQSSTYDNNFITAFEKACVDSGLKKNEYDIKTDVAEDYNRIYTASKEWAEDGYSLVCADSFGHQNGMLPVAKEYPNTEFCHATGTLAAVNKDVKNFHNAFASIYEGRFLSGIIAGYKIADDIKDNKYTIDDAVIGYVGAMPYAEVISGYTSFYLGVKYALKQNKLDGDKLKMKVRYTNSWYNYKAEKEAAEVLISEGCKLISQHADSMGAPIACKEHNIPNVCYNVETKQSCPDTFLVASRINWYNYFLTAINVAKNNYEARQKGETPTSTIINDYCGILDVGDPNSSVDFCRDENNKIVYGKLVSEEAKAAVEQAKNDLKNNAIKVFDTSTFTITYDKNYSSYHKTQRFKIEDDKPTGKLISYKPNCIDNDEFYTPDDVEVITTLNNITYVNESYVTTEPGEEEKSIRSAPYFDLIIDGIDVEC